MSIDSAVLRESLADEKARSLVVYRHSGMQEGSERSEAFALGRYKGFKEALRLLDEQDEGDRRVRSAEAGRLPRSPGAFPPFSAIFQKLRPKHGPSTLGRW